VRLGRLTGGDAPPPTTRHIQICNSNRGYSMRTILLAALFAALALPAGASAALVVL
jgi:hypothetical protein